MRKIGIIYGMETSFPPALVDRINGMRVEGVQAEHVHIGGIKMAEPSGYRVIVDRISHDIAFYRAYLKNAALNGATIINNPFWWGADDKFFNYALASKIGVAVPPTVLLPHKSHPPGTTALSMRNLMFPLNWDEIFEYIGFPAFLKPFSGGGWKSVYKVDTPAELFHRLRRHRRPLHDASESRQLYGILPLLRGRPAEGAHHAATTRAVRTRTAMCWTVRRSIRKCTGGWKAIA